MFANELLLRNESQDGQSYQIQKANEDSAGIEKILVDGYPVEWEMNNESIGFSCTIPPNTEILIQIQYRSSLGPVTEGDSLKSMTKTALRRFLCEFRDTFLSRHARLLSVAQKTKSYLARR
jgi:hypothetical protein